MYLPQESAADNPNQINICNMSSLEEVFEDGYDSGGEMGHLYNAV